MSGTLNLTAKQVFAIAQIGQDVLYDPAADLVRVELKQHDSDGTVRVETVVVTNDVLHGYRLVLTSGEILTGVEYSEYVQRKYSGAVR